MICREERCGDDTEKKWIGKERKGEELLEWYEGKDRLGVLDGWTRLKYGKNVSGENCEKMCCGPKCYVTNEVNGCEM